MYLWRIMIEGHQRQPFDLQFCKYSARHLHVLSILSKVMSRALAVTYIAIAVTPSLARDAIDGYTISPGNFFHISCFSHSICR